jgi:hypothetical protein
LKSSDSRNRKIIPVFNLASNHQWNVTLSDVRASIRSMCRALKLACHWKLVKPAIAPWCF